MEKYDIYKDIAKRTGGDIYLGVVGPVRTGKSSFISKFMEQMVLPNISNKLQKQIATDEMPQSADGKTIMTTEPKFIPANAVKVQFKNKVSANVRLVDCVGYVIEGAVGHVDEGRQRLVRTPWSDKEIPFEKAAEIGTKKVISDYSTVGVLVTTDGSVTELPRENYVLAEERIVRELKDLNKPFVIVLNTKNENDKKTLDLADDLEKRYGVSVIVKNVLNLNENDFSSIIEKLLLEFPMNNFDLNLPDWMRVLSEDSVIIQRLVNAVKERSQKVCKMCNFDVFNDLFINDEYFNPLELSELKLGEGVASYDAIPKDGLFYKVLSDECGEKINSEKELMSYIKEFSTSKKRFDKIKSALDDAEETGYGVVLPSVDEMNLEEPILVKQSGGYGVKLKASAPSLHIMKVDVASEVAPIVGSEKQGEDLVNCLMKQFEDNPVEIWNTNMFGKSLHDLVNEGLSGKLVAMPKNVQEKLRKTITRIVNENKGGVICILL